MAYKFHPLIEGLTYLKLSLWGKIKLAAYPRKALGHADAYLRRKHINGNKIAYFIKVCEEWCKDNNIEPNHTLSDELAQTAGQPFRADWTLDKDSTLPTQLPPDVAALFANEDEPELTGARPGEPLPNYDSKWTESFSALQMPDKLQQLEIMALYFDEDIVAMLKRCYTQKEVDKIHESLCYALLAGHAKLNWIPIKEDAVKSLEIFTKPVEQPKEGPLKKFDLGEYRFSVIMNYLLGKTDFNDGHTDHGLKPYRMVPYYTP